MAKKLFVIDKPTSHALIMSLVFEEREGQKEYLKQLHNQNLFGD